MKTKLIVHINGSQVYGTYFDSHLLNDEGDTVIFSGYKKRNNVFLDTSDSLGERESLSVSLTHRDNNGLALKKRVRPITVKEAVQEVFRFKTFQDFN